MEIYIKIKRIRALVLHYLYSNSIKDRICSNLYWIFLNVIIWGASSSWLEKSYNLPNLKITILTSVALWQIVFKVNIEVCKNLYQEIISKNLINLFASPLKLNEWILAIIFLAIIETILITSIAFITILSIYSVNILNLDLIIPIILLLISGLTIGFMICSLILIFKKKAQDFIYSFGYLFVPFSAIYYPVNNLPYWGKFISKLLPMSYVFEFIRSTLYKLEKNSYLLKVSLALNIIYFIFSIIIFYLSFKFSKKNGYL